MNTVYNAHNLNILTPQLSTSIVFRNKICQLCRTAQWDASLNQLVGICTQKKVCSLFLSGDGDEDIEIFM